MQFKGDFKPDVGSCAIFFGSMWSSKTTELCKTLTMYADIGLRVLYINHADDIRVTEKGSNNLTTHHSSFVELSEKITKTCVKKLEDINIDEFDVIGVDEGHFFSDLDTEVRKWVLEKNKIVNIASLDGDFRMRPIGKAKNLICLCEPGNIIKLAAKCMDCLKQETPYNRIQLVNAGFTCKIAGSFNKQKEVGGKDKYIPLCMRCHKVRMQKTVSKG